jgi:hypothetical protein
MVREETSDVRKRREWEIAHRDVRRSGVSVSGLDLREPNNDEVKIPA